MTKITLQQFGGMLPRYGNQSIPPNAASIARNCRLLSGELQALKRPAVVQSFPSFNDGAIQRVFRVVSPETAGFYACFTDDTVDFVKAPLVNDGFNRHYWTTTLNGGYARYADDTMLLADYTAGDAPTGLRLGVPAPWTAPTVTPAATGGTLEETRVYVYTFVTSYGEESAPSPPTIATGNADANWSITNLDGLDEVESQLGVGVTTSEFDITEVYVYRTITGTTGAVEYFRVAELAVTAVGGGTGSHTDSMSADTASLQPVLESETWNTPPAGLTGLLVHPNGFLVAFSGRDVYFSVPYRPHAWPTEYILSTKWTIVGLGIIGQSIVILTNGSPYVASGVRPEAMTLVESDTPDACTSRRGIVSTNKGVFFPGPDGLMIAGPNGAVENLTKRIVSRREWRTQYRPYGLEAVRHNDQYVAFYSATEGFSIDFEEPNQAFVELSEDAWNHTVIQNDPISGDVWLIRDNTLYVWNPENGSPVTYVWRSREFEVPDPTNFGAVQITYSEPTTVGAYTPEQIEAYTEFNAERIAYPLNPLNFAVMNGVRQVTLTSTEPQLSQQLHAGPLFDLSEGSFSATLTFRIYVNRETDWVYSQEITDMDMYRPPTGFKAVLWYFEFEGTMDVQVARIASNAKELAAI